jgi:hypothetical protein
VELGKELAVGLEPLVRDRTAAPAGLDGSTAGLIDRLHALKRQNIIP